MADGNATQNKTHIDDVAGYFNCCSDTFGQLAAILKAIEKDLPEYGDLRKLAGAGVYLATDFENMADCWREEVKAKGVRMQ